MNSSEEASQADEVATVAARVSAILRTRWFAQILLFTIIASEGLLLLLTAARKSFWYDELVTEYLGSLHPFSAVLKALMMGVDAMTPGYLWAEWLANSLPVDPHITLRLLSIAGYLAALWAAYWFARRWLPVEAGLTAVLLLTLTPLRNYALDARPYSLLVGLVGVAALCWQRIDEKRLMTVWFTVALILATAMHYFALMAVPVFVCAELYRSLQKKEIRRKVWCACLIGILPTVACAPILLHVKKLVGKAFWSPSSFRYIVTTYEMYLDLSYWIAFALVLFCALLAADWMVKALWRGDEPREDVPAIARPSFILAAGLLFYPAALAVATRIAGAGYTPRYGWPAVLGMVLAPVYVLRPLWTKAYSAYVVLALLISCGIQTVSNLDKAFGPDTKGAKVMTARLAAMSRSVPESAVVIGSPVSFLERIRYAPQDLRDRLAMVSDQQQALKFVGSDTGDESNRKLAQFVPLPVENAARFFEEHRHFLLESGGPGDWVTPYLLQSNYKMRLVGNFGENWLFAVEH